MIRRTNRVIRRGPPFRVDSLIGDLDGSGFSEPFLLYIPNFCYSSQSSLPPTIFFDYRILHLIPGSFSFVERRQHINPDFFFSFTHPSFFSSSTSTHSRDLCLILARKYIDTNVNISEESKSASEVNVKERPYAFVRFLPTFTTEHAWVARIKWK